MREFDFHYSPFIALGLDAEQKYSEKDIEKAFRQASLHCHPDRRRIVDVKLDRWPTITHLKDSREYITGLLNRDLNALRIPPDRFLLFPISFDPRHPLGDAKVYHLTEKPGIVWRLCGLPRSHGRDEVTPVEEDRQFDRDRRGPPPAKYFLRVELHSRHMRRELKSKLAPNGSERSIRITSSRQSSARYCCR
ncbi:hypothetical protein BKA67DRAFT_647442 [Truncatella angustata]|uniref:J domain-containing protein n=1 Tax=Truncatella angustata TaxID=152316 RepID=A0A9P8ZY41_9PEZI|nr:uncharacterized protein BKA67DRAFT_647442 [Truncatella angustata]KAH6653644.1 hypothetical protein BKA67DRAFT_647442 [Truncatella angustata]